MNKANPNTLEDVLYAYLTSVEQPDKQHLKEWIKRYPQYKQELTEFTIAWIQMEALPPAERSENDFELLTLRGISVAQNVLHRKRVERDRSKSSRPPFQGILAASHARGFVSNDQFTTLLQLSEGLLRKLDLRWFLLATIPLELIETLTEVLQQDAITIIQYLKDAPAPIANARYHANRVPPAPTQEDFFEAVRKDPSLKPEYREHWLALKDYDL